MSQRSLPLFIYVSGPYSAQLKGQDEEQQIKKNIQTANAFALEIVAKGHYPFVPHTMMQHWEDHLQLSREQVLNICLAWVSKCDALFFINTSKGAELEKELAENLNLKVYYRLEDIPVAEF